MGKGVVRIEEEGMCRITLLALWTSIKLALIVFVV